MTTAEPVKLGSIEHLYCPGPHSRVSTREDAVLVYCEAAGTTEEWNRCAAPFHEDTPNRRCLSYTKGNHLTCYYHSGRPDAQTGSRL